MTQHDDFTFLKQIITDKVEKARLSNKKFHYSRDETLRQQSFDDQQQRFDAMLEQQQKIAMKEAEYDEWHAGLTDEQKAEFEKMRQIRAKYTDEINHD